MWFNWQRKFWVISNPPKGLALGMKGLLVVMILGMTTNLGLPKGWIMLKRMQMLRLHQHVKGTGLFMVP